MSRTLLVSRHVLEGLPAGFVYRERSMHAKDTGWRVFSGDESGEYLADPANIVEMPLAELTANYQELTNLFDAPLGRVYERDESGWQVLSQQGE
ncbi:immunity protein Imm33 domain-containing protein [Paraferrimonas sedimenticola]|uniref:Immunity protein Imm33 domain-containing protein n=1 Tax=Paraferrimonas sedimenticola TaxID=375674 RepID=A0AA37RYJ2_9GAMM|nr:DUF2185 domain-containing protein [Paraferrimonas sedimenticola]GLP97785.1 hypothetical protein GCM10007895_30920 [Paraferrimonas sedimenticola]